MRLIKKINYLQSTIQALRGKKKRIGFVPTMGALHEGHLSLIRRSRRENDITVLSIFVNPAQFGPKEDFSTYPRPEKNDILLAKKELVDIIFYPSEKEMYPTGYLTSIHVGEIANVLCGQSRPGHFAGVATVVCKLLNAAIPDVMYLGQKDAQQTVVLKRMVADLNIPVTVRVCPIVREQDGLAMSSRNTLLSSRHRKEAPVLYASLMEARRNIQQGARDARVIVSGIRSKIRRHSSGRIDYVACVNAKTLVPLKRIRGNVLIALAVKFHKTRLIDNIILNVQ